MSPQFSDELRVLRERAYGPSADIHDDPAAVKRLRELEDLSRTEASEHVATPIAQLDPPPLSAPAAVEAPERVDAPAASGIEFEPPHPDAADAAWRTSAPSTTFPGARADPGSSTETPAGGIPAENSDEPPSSTPDPGAPTPWWRRRVTLIWAGSLLVTAAIAVAATLWSVQAQGRVAVLQPADAAEWPSDVLGEAPENGRVFDEYFGLMVVIMPQAWGPGDAMDCLYVLESTPEGFMSTIGCAAGAFPPSAALAVSDNAPDELRERHPDGTALQFVLTGDQVHVYAQQP